ncbi:MAG: biotin/lipoyl-containing protein [Desulfoprunum sp.]
MKKFRVRVNGKEYEVEIEELAASPSNEPAVATPPRPTPPAQPAPTAAKTPPRPATPAAPSAVGAGTISAPMPGTILEVKVQAGDRVAKGQILMILEAMKMENEILAPHDCTIAEVRAVKGASVNAGDPLVVLA